MVSDLRETGFSCIHAEFQSALRFAVVSDEHLWQIIQNGGVEFQSALRFAVVSDDRYRDDQEKYEAFQSALRFAVVSDPYPLGMLP